MPSASSSTLAARPEGALAPFVRAIRAHPLLIFATVVVAVAVGVAVAKARKAQYVSTAQVLVTPLPEGGGNGAYTGLPVITSSAAEPTRTLETAASVLKSPQAAAATAKAIPGWSVASVSKAVAVEPKGESNIVGVTATAGSSLVAAKLANEYANNALSVRSAELSREATTLISQLQARESAVPASDVTTLSQLSAQITSLVPVSNGHDPNFSLVQAALPGTLSGTSTSLIALLALLAGLVIGIGAALVIEFVNKRIRNEEEALSIYPLPVLTRVPQLPRGAAEATSPELMSPNVREAFRTLQVQLPPGPTGRGRSIMFTSPSMGDGKTASAINLALVLAAAGRTAILFDFDLRKPDVGSRLGIHADMMDLFRAGGGELADVLVESSVSPQLRVISTSRREDVTPLLEAVSRRLPTLLEEATELADYVIVDTAPLGQVSDALRVAALVDEVVLVVRATNTDRSELKQTYELLERVGVTPTGMLIIGETPGSSTYGVYGAGDGSANATAGASLRAPRSAPDSASLAPAAPHGAGRDTRGASSGSSPAPVDGSSGSSPAPVDGGRSAQRRTRQGAGQGTQS